MPTFNNSQRLGLDIDKHIALDAGAGTGKTTVMAQRYIQHLLASIQRSTLVTPPGPREHKIAPSRLTTAPKERTRLDDWHGLLPAETVAITFTRKSAGELKTRIRSVLSNLRDSTMDKKEGSVYDPRLRQKGDVEMLLSQLDNAPISTIDSFLSQLVQPYLDHVAFVPPSEQISEETARILIQETMSSVWRFRHEDDALAAGLLEHPRKFIDARDRLTVRLGGQTNAETVLLGLMGKSMFVEEAHRNLLERAEQNEIPWNGQNPPPVALLYDIMLEKIDHATLTSFVNTLLEKMRNWVDVFREHASNCMFSSPEHTQSRMHHLIYLIEHPPSTEIHDQLRWIWRMCLSLSSATSLLKGNPSYFPYGILPDDEWPGGLRSKGKSLFKNKDLKNQVYGQAKEISDDIKRDLLDKNNSIMLLLARCIFTIDPNDGYSFIPPEAKEYLLGLDDSIPIEHGGRGFFVNNVLQMEVLQDLFLVHKGAQQLFSKRKSIDGFHDYDDIQRFAADLLLARCPDVCRHFYPEEAVQALDSMTNDPWTDTHIARALTILHDNEPCRLDLQSRFRIVQSIRSQFRAFIIDEYQDTNPGHARLLARLWGRRSFNSDDVSPPLGYWDPTVCIVGDMKQSIYRFRQAEVSVMQKMVHRIREANRQEETDSRFSAFKKDDHGRDPRPVGDGAFGQAFTNEHGQTEKSAPYTFVHVARNDADGSMMTDLERVQRRREGHIDLTTNYRTKSHLLHFLNDVFEDVFSPRHHTITGNWYADSQRLQAGRTDEGGQLEWLMPIQTEMIPAELDMNQSFDPFLDSRTSQKQLENELIAQRISSLITGQPSRIFDSEQNEWITLPQQEPYQPNDIMVLFHARTHVQDLIERLSRRGIPATSDKQGNLLHQPVIQPLLSLLELLAYPSSRRAMLGILRSPLSGISDDDIHTFFTTLDDDDDLLCQIQHLTLPESIHKFYSDILAMKKSGKILELFGYVLDYSDLLVVHPTETERNHADTWLELLRTSLSEHGHNLAAVCRHMRVLTDLKQNGPPATSIPTANAVQIMTLHKAKGLQAKVVIVAGLFDAGSKDASQSVKDNVLVTPQVVAGRIQPWIDNDRPQDALWEFTKAIEDAQGRAERRRQLYVALTRVEDHLILVGSPSSKATLENDGTFSMRRSDSVRAFGGMLLDSLRYVAQKGGQETSPWLIEGDELDIALRPMTASKLKINPASLFADSTFHADAIRQVSIFHHPACFSIPQPPSVLAEVMDLYERTHERLETSTSQIETPRLSIQTHGAAYSLDSTHRCPRRHWLTEVQGYLPEPILVDPVDVRRHQSQFPTPTDFGLIMHRLLEIGLPTPDEQSPTTPPLSQEWVLGHEDQLTNETTVTQVMAEYGITSTHETYAATLERVMTLGRLIREEYLGKLVHGATINGFSIEGLRTELPFYFVKRFTDCSFSNIRRTPFGDSHRSIIDEVNMSFNGRIDLTLALQDESNQGYLQVVDLKTTGCLDSFSIDGKHLHPLQENQSTSPSTQPLTKAEMEIVKKYSLQLTLYSLALESVEQRKPKDKQRKILPPAILIGASGRMVQLPDSLYEEAIHELNQHLEWRAAVAAIPENLDAPDRREDDEECTSCPFYQGKIRRCGPVGQEIGLIDGWQ